MKKTIKTTANQTLIDIAVKYYGTAEAIPEVIQLNNDLKNDPASLAALGIDYIANNSLYLDVALANGQVVVIDTDSALLRQTTTRELQGKEINTFDL